MDFHKRKQERKKHYYKYVYGWKERPCTACSGSGYYDNTGSPPCGSCEGTGKERYRDKSKTMNLIWDKLKELYPDTDWEGPNCTADPLQALVATMLSAQCRDDYVDRVTPTLFAKYPSVQDYVDVPLEELQADINSINHYKKKGDRIKKCCEIFVKDYNGKVPENYDDLINLPGVGEKTANAVLRRLGRDAGVVVDTHVLRTSYRLGLTENTNPSKVRKDLEEQLPKEDWGRQGWRLILHGRNVCHARKPDCENCALLELCPKNGVEQ